MRTAIATRARGTVVESPRAEWDGAALRNSRVHATPSYRCGRPKRRTTGRRRARLPRRRRAPLRARRAIGCGRGAGVAARRGGFDVVLRVAVLEALRSSRFQLAAPDARLLLLRLAHNEPLHQESGGGSRRSNLELCLYLLQMAGHQLQDRDAGGAADAALAQRERRHLDAVVAASLDRAQGSADQRKRAAEAAPHAALLSLFSASNDRWSVQRKRRACARALKRSVDRAKSRAAASAAARSRRGRGLAGPALAAEQPAAPSSAAAPAPAPADVEAATAARAVTYARATLAYVALVDKLQSGSRRRSCRRRPSSAAEGRTSLFGGDDAGIGRCAAGGELLRLAAPRPAQDVRASWTWTRTGIGRRDAVHGVRVLACFVAVCPLWAAPSRLCVPAGHLGKVLV